ncbi:MAG: hypothetical protein ACXVA9_04160, partial [Bdellovibrionales bacterium]
MVFQNGIVTELKVDPSQPPLPFAKSKVRLHDSTDATGTGLQKAAAPVTVTAGTELGVIMDNQCLQESQDNLGSTKISKAAAAKNEML